jgi:hypothetical protein
MSTARGTKVNFHPARALQRGLGRDRRLGRQFSPRPSSRDVIKALDPLGVLPPRSRDTWRPLERRGATGPPTMTPTPTDGIDVTVRSEQEHRNHALTQHDPRHSTTTTSILLQRWGDGNYTAYSPPYANPDARIACSRWHRSTQHEAWPQHVAPADRETKRSTFVTSLRYRGNCSHQIRRRTAAPETTFFIFLFHLFPISSFYHKYNLSPSLRNYKRGGRGHNVHDPQHNEQTPR